MVIAKLSILVVCGVSPYAKCISIHFTGNCDCCNNIWGRNISYSGQVDFHLLMQILRDLKGNLVHVHCNSQYITPNLLF